ncbi:carotenoid oxygenase family protein [soil metagenome]
MLTHMETSLDTHGIFRSSPDKAHARATIRGAVPSWLRGDLVRTAPACFAEGKWRARHWFDGLGVLYAFRIGDGVRFEQKLLASEARKRIVGGRDDTPHLGTSMHRGFWDRLFHPVPRANDNTNVNVVPFGDDLVAMTETTEQHLVDRQTLEVRGTLRYEDSHGDLFMLAHPHADFARKKVVNVASELGARPALVVYEHGFSERSRAIVGRIPFAEVPYVHSFGLTPKHAIILGGPYAVKSWHLLWSDKGYVEHFRWKPEAGTTIDLVDRSTGKTSRHMAPAMFVFHTINSFERGDETVHDVLAYDDASIIERLSVENLAKGLPELRPKPTRLVLRRGRTEATVELLSDGGFEFPSVDYRRNGGADYRVAWGADTAPKGNGYESALVKLSVGEGTHRMLAESGFVFGEPVFVAKPCSVMEGEGVLLAVASHAESDRAALAIVDAQSLDMIAWCEIDAAIPLGFHGSFLRAP